MLGGDAVQTRSGGDTDDAEVWAAANQSMQCGFQVLGVAREIDQRHAAAGLIGQFHVAQRTEAVSLDHTR